MKKFTTEAGKIYFKKKYYIIDPKSEVQADGYDKKKEAQSHCPDQFTICTPKDLIAITAAWGSLQNVTILMCC